MMRINTITRSDRVLLYNLSWQQFEHLIQDLGQQAGVRIAYDSGTLEILTPLLDHERIIVSILRMCRECGDNQR